MPAGLDELSYYDLLGVDRDAGVDAVRQAFHAFARRYHPDNHTDDPARHRRATAIFRRDRTWQIAIHGSRHCRADALLFQLGHVFSLGSGFPLFDKETTNCKG